VNRKERKTKDLGAAGGKNDSADDEESERSEDEVKAIEKRYLCIEKWQHIDSNRARAVASQCLTPNEPIGRRSEKIDILCALAIRVQKIGIG
jgi:hypothetical protein